MSKRVDLLNGNILGSLTKLALPIMGTSILHMAYNLTDMIWIGRIGANAVAAVGAAGMFMWLAEGIAILARTGGQVKTGHALGAGNIDEAKKYSSASIQMAVVLSVIYSVIILAFSKPLIGFFKLTGENVNADAEGYLKIVGGLIIFQILNMVLTGIVTATGNSRTPFAATIVGLTLNIVLDPVLIFGLGGMPKMGVEGAAWATVISQAVVTAMFVLSLRKDTGLFANLPLLKLQSMERNWEIAKIGIPTAVQSMLFSLIAMVIARIVASWGSEAVAVQKVGSQIEAISWMTSDGFSIAINSFIAQNHGAGNIKRCTRGIRTALGTISVWGVISSLILILLARPIFAVFIPDENVIPMGVQYLIILGFSQLFMCIEIVGSGVLAGFGKTLTTSLTGIVLTGARIPLALALSKTPLQLNGVWWSISISSVVKGIVIFILVLLFAIRLKKEKLQQN